MKLETDIERAGFYPQIVGRAMKRALGEHEPLASLVQVDAAFDRGSMFRHLTLVAVTSEVIVHLHVDELETGAAGVTTMVRPIGEIVGVSMMEVYPEPQNEHAPSEITLSIDMGSQRRSEIESMHCDDPACSADHGYSATTFPDDLTLRVSDIADGTRAMEDVHRVADAISRLLAERRS